MIGQWARLAMTFCVLTTAAVLGAPGIARPQNRAAPAAGQIGEAPKVEGANDTTEPPLATSRNANRLGKPLMRNLVSDQEAIWTSPFHLRWADTDWLIPLAGVTAGFFATDHAAVNSLSS